MSPNVSIIMAVKNEMPHLPLAVESILEQTYRDFEFLIVDDNSTDGTPAYLKSLMDLRVRLLRNQGKGQTAGLNMAIREARGTWIARMDGDDWSYPERLARQTEAVAEDPLSILISTDYTICNDNFFPIASIRLDPTMPGLFFHYIERRNNPFCHPTMMFKREETLQVGGYDEILKNAQDFSLWKKLLKKGHWKHVSDILLDYRVRKQSLSILRHSEQEWERRYILKGTRIAESTKIPDHDFFLISGAHAQEGLYAYKLGFAAWTAGMRAICYRYLFQSLFKGVRPVRSLILILMSFLPRSFYLSLGGYRGVFR